MYKFFQSARLADKLILFSASFFILLLSTFAACKKDIFAPPAFPAATQTGANTMGAIVNGNQFIAYQLPGSLLQSLIAQYDDQSFSLFGDDPSREFGATVVINIYGVNGTGNYKLINQNGFPGNNWGEIVIVSGTSQFHYFTDSIHTGTVTITRFDTIKHIISGVFSMTPKLMYSSALDTIANVQNGRFDVTYHP